MYTLSDQAKTCLVMALQKSLLMIAAGKEEEADISRILAELKFSVDDSKLVIDNPPIIDLTDLDIENL